MARCVFHSGSLDLPSKVEGSSHPSLLVVTDVPALLSDNRFDYILETSAEAGIFLLAVGLLDWED